MDVREAGKKGGQSKSPAKQAAARSNGRKRRKASAPKALRISFVREES